MGQAPEMVDGRVDKLYDEEGFPPFVESPLDSERHVNKDIPLDKAVANNGGHFSVSNSDILNAKWW